MKSNKKLEDKYICEYLHMCPAFMKCRIGGIYTRKNTINCNCRDFIAQKEKHENSSRRV